MNRSHKQELIRLKSKNEYTSEDLESAKELLKFDDPPFHEDVKEVVEKIQNILKEYNNH